jgi:hypothetical protein
MFTEIDKERLARRNITHKIEKRIRTGVYMSVKRDGTPLYWLSKDEAGRILGWTERQLDWAFVQFRLFPARITKKDYPCLSGDQVAWLLLLQHLFRRRPVAGIGKQLRAKYKWQRMSFAAFRVWFRPFSPRNIPALLRIHGKRLSREDLALLLPGHDFSTQVQSGKVVRIEGVDHLLREGEGLLTIVP